MINSKNDLFSSSSLAKEWKEKKEERKKGKKEKRKERKKERKKEREKERKKKSIFPFFLLFLSLT